MMDEVLEWAIKSNSEGGTQSSFNNSDAETLLRQVEYEKSQSQERGR